MNQLFASGGQNIGVSASTPVLPMNTQDLSPLGWTGWISLQSKGLSRVFSNTTVQTHQFFITQLSSQSNSLRGTLAFSRKLGFGRFDLPPEMVGRREADNMKGEVIKRVKWLKEVEKGTGNRG